MDVAHVVMEEGSLLRRFLPVFALGFSSEMES